MIPHIHWEGAVFKTREEYLEMGLPIIFQVLNMLKTYPNYRFVLNQVAYVKPFLERYPEEEAAFRKMIAEGKGSEQPSEENDPPNAGPSCSQRNSGMYSLGSSAFYDVFSVACRVNRGQQKLKAVKGLLPKPALSKDPCG